MKSLATPTAATLAGIAGLHVAWATGSAFPCKNRDTLARCVMGSDAMAGPGACLAVGAVLAGSAGLVTDVLPVRNWQRRVGLVGVASALAGRGIAGVTGRTVAIVPWTPSDRFVELDRRFYGPLCLGLAVGTLQAALGGTEAT